MSIKRLFGKTTYLLAAAAVALTALLGSGRIVANAEEELKEASFCSFVIPSTFEPGQEKGLFINKMHPMESSTIRYSVYYNGLDVVLTNREMQELKDHGGPTISNESQRLTKEMYEQKVSEAYNEQYGEDVGFAVSSFENITIDGYPGFKIESSYKAGDQEQIHQTVFMMLSKYRTFTITYQRAEDDDCEELFSNSQATIHIH